jgi:hypothetical protein
MRYPINTSNSDAIDTLIANPITGSVRIRFHKTPARIYRLKASRLEILMLLLDSNQSLGQWINWHCLPA